MKKNKHFQISIVALISLLLELIPIEKVQAAAIPLNFAQSQSPISQTTLVTNYIDPAINFLSAGVGVVIIAMMVIGAIQYSTSGGNPQGEADARKKISNAILAFLVFIFIYAFLNFIVPGGLVSL